MTTTINVSEFRGGVVCFDIVGAASVAAGGIGAVANPFGEAVAIVGEFLYVTTNSTGAANLSIGIGAEAAASTDIINALAMAAAAGIIYQGAADAGAKTAVVPAIWTTALYLNVAGSASTVGLVAKLFLQIIRLG
jgi:hypothetical protein